MEVLQYGDSFFPSGAVSFSWGLEALVERGVLTDANDIQAFLIGQLHARWASFDRPVVAAAYRAAGDLQAVAGIDEMVELLTSSAEMRSASRRMGEAMASIFARLGHAEAVDYRTRIKSRFAYGHLAVMQGFLWARSGLAETEAMALSVHGFCVGLLGAGLRLGCLTHIDAQRILTAAGEVAAQISIEPIGSLDDISSYGFEAEIAIMRHAFQDIRLFSN
ncbi:MAG: urease accessory protein UreF [Hyphomicrobiales bacterium]